MKKQVIEENLALVQNTLEQWLSFRRYMTKAFSEAEIASPDETDFLEVKSAIAKNVRNLGERMKEIGALDYGEKSIRELLNKCVSVSHLRNLPPRDQSGLRQEWHVVFVRMSRSVGALKFLSEGYVPQTAAKGRKRRKGLGKGAIAGIVAAVVVVVAVIAAFALGLVG